MDKTEGQSTWPQSGQTLSSLPPISAEGALMPMFAGARVFDVCHVGVVLRAVLGVQGLLALGVALASRDLTQWLDGLSRGTVVSLSAVLGWLLLVCAMRRPLARLGETQQWLLLCLLGALCASLGWQLLHLASEQASGTLRLVAVALSGSAGAALLLYWLKLREQAFRPADAMARLVELQSRIRPHFLFNTLNSAITLVQVDPQRAEQILEDLSELFRGALAEPGAVVSLAEEVELARRYLEIEQLRFGDRLRVQWKLDAAASRCRVPPLLLQPLVENAVRHGVEPNEQGGELQIGTRVRGDEVEIRIVNSVGAPGRPGHGLALRNVRERLRLMHDVAARFEIERQRERYTVRIVLPL